MSRIICLATAMVLAVGACEQRSSEPAEVPMPRPEATASIEAPECADPQVYAALHELWLDEYGVGQAYQITRISDDREFRYDRVRKIRYCNASIFINGYDVTLSLPNGGIEIVRHEEDRVGYTVDYNDETTTFDVRVGEFWSPHIDTSYPAMIGVALAQRPERCQEMLREFASNPQNHDAAVNVTCPTH